MIMRLIIIIYSDDSDESDDGVDNDDDCELHSGPRCITVKYLFQQAAFCSR